MNRFDNACFYHIYPLGYCGCEKENDFTSEPTHRILKVIEQIPILKENGFNAVYFGPVFESSKHGYDTADYLTIDRRLGTNEDFAAVCKALHENGFLVVLDGVFNHVGRDFWAFRDVREHRFESKYKDWFHLEGGNSCYNDGFWYEGWEGHFELVKLNPYSREVRDYLKSVISQWVKEFDIDGIRLDVAYCLDLNFLKELHGHCKYLKPDFWLLGETLHGDYKKWMNDEMLDSVTNYECYKGLYSSFNELNMFEIAYSLQRQFGTDQWCLYTGRHLYCFVDNHDVTRIATMLKDKSLLPAIYTLLFTMPGVPAVYYGSEYGFEGDKRGGDDALRVEFKLPEDYRENALTKHIAKLTNIHSHNDALCCGSYRQLQLLNRQFCFMREFEGKKTVVMINADGSDFTFNCNVNAQLTDALSGESFNLAGGVNVPAHGSRIFTE